MIDAVLDLERVDDVGLADGGVYYQRGSIVRTIFPTP